MDVIQHFFPPLCHHAQLLKLGLDFRPNQLYKMHWDDKWNAMFEEYIKYKAAHGKDPSKDVKDLGDWASLQRMKYRKGTIKEDRSERLNGVGFDFTVGDEQSEIAAQKKLASEEFEKMFIQILSFYKGKSENDLVITHFIIILL